MRAMAFAVAVSAAVASQGWSQTAAAPQPVTTVVVEEPAEPIPLTDDAPAGSSSPGSIASAGVGAGVVLIGLLLISSLAFFPSQ
jgi:hypothetical protein